LPDYQQGIWRQLAVTFEAGEAYEEQKNGGGHAPFVLHIAYAEMLPNSICDTRFSESCRRPKIGPLYNAAEQWGKKISLVAFHYSSITLVAARFVLEFRGG
jgi:hypothetical protein